jgi:hypothetical protein
MNLKYIFAMIIAANLSILAQSLTANITTREHIRVVHQDLSKWDKNGDGKLTGSERAAFAAAKRKEMADAADAARAAKAKPPTTSRTVKPVLSPEDAQKPTPKGVPKNIEDSASVQRP